MAGEENMVQVSASDWKMATEAHKLLDKLYTGAETSFDFKKMAKSAGYNVPELDTIEREKKPIMDKLASFEEENKKLKEEWETEKKTRAEREEEGKLKETALARRQKENDFRRRENEQGEGADVRHEKSRRRSCRCMGGL